jgi:sirohydrochlorin ferrochelatase
MRTFGVLIISHGSRSPEWVRQVDDAVAGVRLPDGVPVSSCFLEIVNGRLIPDGIRSLEEQGVTDIVAVPLFISGGSTHVDEIAYALGVVPAPSAKTALRPLPLQSRIHWTGPVDDDPDVAQMVYDKIKPLSRNPAQETLLLVGHGSSAPGFSGRWCFTLEKLAARIRRLGGFSGTATATLLPDELGTRMREIRERELGKEANADPDGDRNAGLETGQKINPGSDSNTSQVNDPNTDPGKGLRRDFTTASSTQKESHRTVLVAPLFLGEGYFTRTVIPSRLEGWDCLYSGEPLLPHPLLSRWIEKKIAMFVDGMPDSWC